LQPSQAGTHDGSMPPPRDAARRAAARWRGSRRFVHFAGFIAIPSVLILAAAAFAMTWRMPTRVQLDLVVDRVTFTLAGNRPVDVPANALSFALLSVENFDRVTFSPRRLRVPTAASERAEPAPGAWREAATRGVLVLSGADDERALLTLDRGGDTAPAGRLQPLSAAPGARVTLEARSGPPARMTLRMDGQALQTNLLPDGEVHLAASHVAIEGLGVPTAGEGEIALQVTLPQDDPFLQVQGARRFFVVTAMVAEAGPVPLLDRAEVKEIEFLRQGSGGAIESALVAGGELTYPGHSGIARRTLAPGDFVGLGSLNAATLTRLELNADRGGIQVRFDGVAGKLDVSSGGVAQDLRVSALEALWHNAQAAVLLSIAVWAIAVSTGASRLYRDFQTT
jgi:hypothetical protein